MHFNQFKQELNQFINKYEHDDDITIITDFKALCDDYVSVSEYEHHLNVNDDYKMIDACVLFFKHSGLKDPIEAMYVFLDYVVLNQIDGYETYIVRFLNGIVSGVKNTLHGMRTVPLIEKYIKHVSPKIKGTYCLTCLNKTLDQSFYNYM